MWESGETSGLKSKLTSTLEDMPKEQCVVHFFGVNGATYVEFVRDIAPGSKIGLDIRAPQLSPPLISAKNRMKIFESIHHIDHMFCSMAMVETFYAGIEQAVPVHELPFGIDRELQQYVTDKPKIRTKKQFHEFNSRSLRLAFVGSIARQRKLEEWINKLSCIRTSSGLRFEVDVYGGCNDPDYLTELKEIAPKLLKFKNKMPRTNLLEEMGRYQIGLALVPFDGPLSIMPSLKLMEYLVIGMKIVAACERQGTLGRQGIRNRK